VSAHDEHREKQNTNSSPIIPSFTHRHTGFGSGREKEDILTSDVEVNS